MKTKDEIVKYIEDAMDGGATAIYDSLVSEGCIEPSDSGKEEEGSESESAQEGEPEEPKSHMPFMMGKKDNAASARKKSAGYASKMMGGM